MPPLTTEALADHPDAPPVAVYETYVVTGATPQEVAHSMTALGPNGKPANTVATYSTSWRPQATGPGECAIAESYVDLAVTVTMPAIVGPTFATQKEEDEWRHYLEMVRLHEDGHVWIAIDAALILQAALLNVDPGGCDEVASQVQDLVHDSIKRASRKQDLYDRQTAHGRTQGTTYPPRGIGPPP